MKIFRVVIDTNVIVSGLRSKQGASYRLLALLDSGRFIANVSVPLVVEYEKALLDPRLRIPFSREEIGRFIDYVCKVSDHRKIYFLWRPRLRDPKDDMILELGVAGRCDSIITFNLKDFRDAGQFGILVATPQQFLNRLGEIK